ncbi:leucine-rich repeat protein SHOC-2-like [Anopheles merus]|uniref:leucine-rich repeat protein SHOC-2-like n=1 Tax=Anopheles merus TaxID=30066 RepID=UPI001BE4D710|nr:leucine-rich repeat protein SHOC-2-like [Anopheles merus]
MFRWVVWLLIVANAASSITALEMICYAECYISNFKTGGDAFAFQHISSFIHVLNMDNVQMIQVDRWILEQLPPYVHTLKIVNSKKLQRVSVSNALGSLHIKTTNLKRIDIAANSSLNVLVISGSDLMQVPHDVKNAQMLSSLRLQKSKIGEIDLAAFCDHSDLSELLLDGNKIRYLVNTSTRNCSIYGSLTGIQLSDNVLTTVNMELFNVFVNLSQLDIQMNKITTLSGRLAHRSLEVLALNENKLGHVDLCGWDVPSMNIVSFSANNLTTLPECITNWTSVSQLILSFNEFTNFGIESVAGMNNLESIDLECNKLAEIVLNSVHFPPKLKDIRISRNYLTSLDLSFIPVRSLDVLVVHNLISSFDASNTSPNVTRLRMKGNQIDCSWESCLERFYGECIRNESINKLREENMKRCDDHMTRVYYV